MRSALQCETFSASVGVLVESNTRLKVSLGFFCTMHRREQSCPSGVRYLQTLAAAVGGLECMGKRSNRLLLTTQALLGEAQAIMSDTEIRLRRHAA